MKISGILNAILVCSALSSATSSPANSGAGAAAAITQGSLAVRQNENDSSSDDTSSKYQVKLKHIAYFLTIIQAHSQTHHRAAMQMETRRLLRTQSRQLLSRAGQTAPVQTLLPVDPAQRVASQLPPRQARRRPHSSQSALKIRLAGCP